MERFSEECLEVFLREQSQLFDEPVAETPEEAEAFLEDCMAVVLDSLEEVRDYLDEYGADVDGMTLGEIEDWVACLGNQKTQLIPFLSIQEKYLLGNLASMFPMNCF